MEDAWDFKDDYLKDFKHSYECLRFECIDKRIIPKKKKPVFIDEKICKTELKVVLNIQ